MTHERVDQNVCTRDGLINHLQSSLQIEFMNVQQALGRLRQTKLLVTTCNNTTCSVYDRFS